MRFSNLQASKWRRYGLAALTLVVFVLLATHPELRLLVPVIDAVGLDVLLVLCGAQALSSSRAAIRLYVLPLVARLYGAVLYFLGIAAPGVDDLVRSHLVSRLAPRVAV
jgi:hypothetical protein